MGEFRSFMVIGIYEFNNTNKSFKYKYNDSIVIDNGLMWRLTDKDGNFPVAGCKSCPDGYELYNNGCKKKFKTSFISNKF